LTTAVFRADGPQSLGMGHVMRCLAFAAGLKGAGLESAFVTKSLGSPVASVVRGNQIDVMEMPSDASLEQDSELTLKLAAKANARFIVTDICHRETQPDPEGLKTYHEKLSNSLYTVCLTGDQMIDLPANILITPYVGVECSHLPDHGGRSVLLGPSYFIFRPEFIEAARTERAINQVARRVLVTVGGSDELHLTTKIAQALCSLPNAELTVTIMIGAGFTADLGQELEDLMANFEGKYQFLSHDTNLAEKMMWADLAITGDGLTKYEAAVTGTPNIVLSRADSEMSMSRKFQSLGTSLNLDDGALIETEDLAREIGQVLNDAPLRISMSRHGKKSIDGNGISRIMANLPKEFLQ